MGVLSRILRLFRADLHGVMDQLEDKSLLLRQCLREMEEGLKQKEARLDQITGTCREIEKNLALRMQEIGKIEKDLDLAVGREKDEIARMLIRKRRTLQGSCEHLQRQLDAMIEEKNKITHVLEQQRLEYERLKVEATAYCRSSGQPPCQGPAGDADDLFAWRMPTEEEIELELLQRKEAFRRGGAA